MKFKIGDILIISFVLISALFILLSGKKEQGDFVVLEIDGRVIKTFSLLEDTEYTYNGDYSNTISVKNGRVCISDANCPDKTCVNSKSISNPNEVICCLPNKLLLRVVSDKNEVDVVSG